MAMTIFDSKREISDRMAAVSTKANHFQTDVPRSLVETNTAGILRSMGDSWSKSLSCGNLAMLSSATSQMLPPLCFGSRWR